MKRGIVVLILLLAAVFHSFLAAGVEVNACGHLSEENQVYKLSKNIIHSGSNHCIKITAENVTLDCRNNSVLTSSKAEVAGIYSESPKTKIRDCSVSWFRNGYGVLIENSDNSVISGISAENNKIGIYSEGDNARIAYNSVNFNEKGVIVRGDYNLISNNNLCYNTIEDINCTSRQIFENNHCDSGSVCGDSCFPCSHKNYELYECRELNESNYVYLLQTNLNISVPGTCFKITAENVTLDCLGHYINYDLDLAEKQEFLVTSSKSRTTIKNCSFRGKLIDLRYTGNAVKLQGIQSSVVKNSFNAVKKAFYSDYCYECNISENKFRNIDGNSVEIILSEGSFIENNDIVSCLNAIKISEGNNTKISNNYLEGSEINSIEVKNDYSRLENNNVFNAKDSAIKVFSSEGAYVVNNKAENSGTGISIIQSRDLLVENNTFTSGDSGIYIKESADLKILGNNARDFSFGFKEDSGENLRMENNVFCGNSVDVSCSSENNFVNNECNSRSVCGGRCRTCGKAAPGLWQRIKNFFMSLF
jgi:parallel beta-helix repeat protein